ncbi:MAG TPA: recombinase RecT [Xanthobacteraceae bacterium]|jgi:recombination protein RecT
MAETAVANAETTKPPHPIIVLRNYLNERIDSLRSALPPHIKPERFVAAVMTAVQINPDLLACDKRSLFVACMRCAQDGLMPDGSEAAIVAYKSTANYLPMYQGLLKKFRNSGTFKWIGASIVYEGEEFAHWTDEAGEHFKHVPDYEQTGDRKVKLVYAAATTVDGGFFVEPMTLKEINKRRNMSRASRDDAPWKMWESEMQKKTALRALAKLLPKSSDVDHFLQRDEQASLGIETPPSRDEQRAAGSALDFFASASEVITPAEGGSEQTPAPAAAAELEEAYERGKKWRASNGERKGSPPEYRNKDRTREHLCWQAGFDGSPLPSFSE